MPQSGSYDYNALEDRKLLANLSVTDGFLIDGLLNQIAGPVAGEEIAAQVNITSEDHIGLIPVDFTLDGYTFSDSVFDTSSGGTDLLNLQALGGWFARPGTHVLQIEVDPDNVISETNEDDNSITVTFTSVSADLDGPFVFPAEGEFHNTALFKGYVDVDPRPGVWTDYAGYSLFFGERDAISVGPITYQQTDEGISVFAAAGGTVVETRDGFYDRDDIYEPTLDTKGNFITIDHGDGWVTQYTRLHRDSIKVVVGQTVEAGQEIALVGGSGFGNFGFVGGPQLDFFVTHHGRVVDPMLDQATFWGQGISHVMDQKVVIDTYVVDFTGTGNFENEGFFEIERLNENGLQAVSVASFISGLEAGDEITYVWTDPDGNLFATDTSSIILDVPIQSDSSSQILGVDPPPGIWTVDVYINGVESANETFEVRWPPVPEIEVRSNFGALVRDGRTTPYHFDSLPGAPEMNFSISNQNEGGLTISEVVIPEGFVLLQAPSSFLIGTFGFTSMKIGMDTTTEGFETGHRAGIVTIYSDDADEGVFTFPIEGRVASAAEGLTLGISSINITEGTSVAANVRRSGPTTDPVTVSLSSSNPDLVLPETVTIPAGQSSFSFFIEAVDDQIVNFDEQVRIVAAADGYDPSTQSVNLIDIGLTNLVPTAGDDIFVVEYGANGNDDVRLTMNGQTYRLSPSILSSFSIAGLSGHDQITVRHAGGLAFANVNLANDSVFADSVFSLFGTGFESIILEGNNSGDMVTVNGSSQDDVFELFDTGSRISNGEVDVEIVDFSNVWVDGGPGGFDSAVVFDSLGDDRFALAPNNSIFNRSDFRLQLTNFSDVRAFSQNGGYDTATLRGNEYYANGVFANMKMADANLNARGFDRVDGYQDGATGQAYLLDSAQDDLFVSAPTSSYLTGSGFFNVAHSFSNVTGIASVGLDRAIMNDSPGDDTFYGEPTRAVLKNSNYRTQANQFDRVTVLATSGENIATLRDSAGDDTYIATEEYALLQSANNLNYLRGFDRVHATSSTGFDKAVLRGKSDNHRFRGNYQYSFLAATTGNEFINSASNFDRLSVFVNNVGISTAEILDSRGDDTFIGNQNRATIFDDQYLLLTEGFDRVTANAVDTGINTLYATNLTYELIELGNWS